jgi:hypothetical protein
METDQLEYRLVWPNHEVYAEHILPENIDLVEEAIHANLKQFSVPQAYWPHREARVLKTVVTEGTWEEPVKAQGRLKNQGKNPGKKP